MTFHFKKSATAAVLALTLPASAHATTELIDNGSFETGLAPWVCSISGDANCEQSAILANTGTNSLEAFENIGVGSVAQTVATTVGLTYDFSFWLAVNSVNPANALSYMLDGAAAVEIVGPATPNTFNYYSSSFVASGASAEIKFLFETDPGTGAFYIDDVSVTAPVPLPAALPLLIAGLGAMGGLHMRRKQAS